MVHDFRQALLLPATQTEGLMFTSFMIKVAVILTSSPLRGIDLEMKASSFYNTRSFFTLFIYSLPLLELNCIARSTESTKYKNLL